VHGQVALEQGEQHSIPNGPERIEVQIAAGIVAGMLEAGVAALVALRLDVLGLQLLLLLGESAADDDDDDDAAAHCFGHFPFQWLAAWIMFVR